MDRIKDKYIKREATDSEKERLFRHLAENKEETERLIRDDTDWTMSNMPNQDAPEYMVELMRKRIGNKRSITLFYKAAAILILPLLSIALYQFIHFSNKIEVLESTLEQRAVSKNFVVPVQVGSTFNYMVNPGVKGMVSLPDGSQVWLNSNSSLECPQKFGKDGRVLELSGEGYFIVKSNKDWPMYIKTKSGYTVKVTGTEFNLSSYSNDSELKLTMVSGIVKLINESNKTELEVNKLEEVIVPISAKINFADKNKANLYLNTSWKNGVLVFDSTPMREVIKKMERWYGVKITAKDTTLLSNRFTAEFDSESLTQVLEFLKMSSNIKYKVKDKSVSLYKN